MAPMGSGSVGRRTGAASPLVRALRQYAIDHPGNDELMRAADLPQALKAVLIAAAILAGKPQPAVAARAAFLTAWQSLS